MAIGPWYNEPLSNFGYALNKEAKAVICISYYCGIPGYATNPFEDPPQGLQHHGTRELHSSYPKPLWGQIPNFQGQEVRPTPHQKPIESMEVMDGFSYPLSNGDGTCCSGHFFHNPPSLVTSPTIVNPRLPHTKSLVLYEGGSDSVQPRRPLILFSVKLFLSDLDPSNSSAYIEMM